LKYTMSLLHGNKIDEGGGIVPSDGLRLRKRIIELETKIAQVTLERDDLARDVESICLNSSSNTTFNASSVLSERVLASGEHRGCRVLSH